MQPDDDPVVRLLLDYPDEIREQAESLRKLVRRAVPDVIERVRPGWRLIGYDVPVGRRTRYFAYVAPEYQHVHLGFEHGTLMTDPDGLLMGAHLRLRKVRYLTYLPGQPIPGGAVLRLIRQAASIAAMPLSERSAMLVTRSG
jgi:hypothetical protein